jgi:hypothetical protein
MVRLAPDEPSIPLKDREGTISTPFRKIFAIICLSPVFARFFWFFARFFVPGLHRMGWDANNAANLWTMYGDATNKVRAVH